MKPSWPTDVSFTRRSDSPFEYGSDDTALTIPGSLETGLCALHSREQ
jgi:hypothetical protein